MLRFTTIFINHICKQRGSKFPESLQTEYVSDLKTLKQKVCKYQMYCNKFQSKNKFKDSFK